MKRLLHIIITILFPLAANADEVEIDGIYYNLVLKNKEAEVIKNPNKYTGRVEIPESVAYDGVNYSVTSIGNSAFQSCVSLTYITIPNSVTSIGSSAFSRCSGLISLTIPNSVTTIGNDALSGCSYLSSIIISNNITKIEDFTFQSCSSLTSISIPNGVTSIGEYAFSYCSGLESITIPNNVSFIGYNAFYYCTSLTSINIPKSITSIGKSTFSDCSSLTSITIPDNVKSIGHYAFRGCSSLTSVTFGDSLTSIGISAFRNCSNLTSVTIPSSVTSIGNSSFQNCSRLTTATLGNNVPLIGEKTFYNCSSLTSITIGRAISVIQKQAFANCVSLTDVFCYPESVPSTSNDAFQDSYIQNATLHVPSEAVNAYKAAEPWKNFKNIVFLENESPDTPKCATPTISYQNGLLSFNCETENVDFVSEIIDSDIKKHFEATISLTVSYTINVYATKSGYENSDIATATLCWVELEPQIDGAENLISIKASPLFIRFYEDTIYIQGIEGIDYVEFYSVKGTYLGSGQVRNGNSSFETTEKLVIVKIGHKSIKLSKRQ